MSDLFSFAEATRRKDRGMALASAAQDIEDPTWAQRAVEAIRLIALRKSTVHIDDFLLAFPERAAHPNANGQVWRQAVSLGFIEECDREGRPHYKRLPCTVDPIKNFHPYPQYKSLLYRQWNKEAACVPPA